MPLKVKEVVDKSEEERERREKATKEHFPENKGLSTAWKLAPVAAHIADGASVVAARKAGAREVNPLQKKLVDKPLLNIPLKAAVGAGSAYIADRVARKNKTAGKILAALGTLPPAVGTASNVRSYVRARKKK